MKSLAVLIVFVAIGFFGTYMAQADSATIDANDSIFKSYGFPSYAGLTHLCQKRVYGSGNEITWDAFAATAEPSEIVEYYLRRLGKSGFTREDKGGTWRLPAGDAHPKRVLNIIPLGIDNPSRDCDEHPPADSHAVILLSKMS